MRYAFQSFSVDNKAMFPKKTVNPTASFVKFVIVHRDHPAAYSFTALQPAGVRDATDNKQVISN